MEHLRVLHRSDIRLNKIEPMTGPQLRIVNITSRILIKIRYENNYFN